MFLADVRNDYVRAEALYKRAIASNPKHANSCYNYAVMLDNALRRYDEAEALYRKALEANPRHAFSWYNLAARHQ